MRLRLTVVCVLMLGVELMSCERSQPPNEAAAVLPLPGADTIGTTSSTAAFAPVALNAYRETLNLAGYDDLGSFHFRRLQFYTKDAPGIRIGPAEVDNITLYFIDRYVVKIRYRLSHDVSAFLADSLAVQAGKQPDLQNNWAKYQQIRWSYFSKLITYQNRCPDDDLANALTGKSCDGGYWLYVELPGYRKKVKELETVARYVKEYLIDDPPNKAAADSVVGTPPSN